jgi:hypothetical protein
LGIPSQNAGGIAAGLGTGKEHIKKYACLYLLFEPNEIWWERANSKFAVQFADLGVKPLAGIEKCLR